MFYYLDFHILFHILFNHINIHAVLKPLPHCQGGKCGGKILKNLLT